jgi:ABC-type multidrug transport system ATPase subunit
VIIINAGKIVAHDRIENLSSALDGGMRLRLSVQGPPDAIVASLKEIPNVRDVRFEAPFHLVTYDATVEPQAEINRRLVAGGWTLHGMEADHVSLEGVFIGLAKGTGP